MGEGIRPHFNLVDEPWIIVKTTSGEIAELSLMQLFDQAADLESLANETPQQDFAILRMLLAILQRAISSDVDDDDLPAEVWGNYWGAGELPLGSIREYLSEWRYRFDLLDDELPFMQVAGLDAKRWDAGKLMLVSEHRDPLTPMRTGLKKERLSLPEAARWLVTVQAFDVGGPKSGVTGDPNLKNNKGYPGGPGWAGRLGGICAEGFTLEETILLNCVLWNRSTTPDELFSDEDLPAWEQSAQPTLIRDREPLGRADLFTWQSRRIRLIPDDNGTTISSVILTVGDRLEKANRQHLEPMSSWSRNSNEEKRLGISPVYTPKRHSAGRALWRGLDSLLPIPSTSDSADEFIVPDVVNWLEFLSSLNGGRKLSSAQFVRLRAIGFQYGTQDSVVTESIDDSVGVHLYLLSSDGAKAVSAVRECIEATDRAIRCLGRLAADLVRAKGFREASGGGSRQGALSKARNSAQSSAYYAIDAHFRLWLASLDESSNISESENEWASTARATIVGIANMLLDQVEPSALVGHSYKAGKTDSWISASSAEGRFWRDLGTVLNPLMLDVADDRKAVAE